MRCLTGILRLNLTETAPLTPSYSSPCWPLALPKHPVAPDRNLQAGPAPESARPGAKWTRGAPGRNREASSPFPGVCTPTCSGQAAPLGDCAWIQHGQEPPQRSLRAWGGTLLALLTQLWSWPRSLRWLLGYSFFPHSGCSALKSASTLDVSHTPAIANIQGYSEQDTQTELRTVGG